MKRNPQRTGFVGGPVVYAGFKIDVLVRQIDFQVRRDPSFLNCREIRGRQLHPLRLALAGDSVAVAIVRNHSKADFAAAITILRKMKGNVLPWNEKFNTVACERAGQLWAQAGA